MKKSICLGFLTGKQKKKRKKNLFYVLHLTKTCLVISLNNKKRLEMDSDLL